MKRDLLAAAAIAALTVSGAPAAWAQDSGATPSTEQPQTQEQMQNQAPGSQPMGDQAQPEVPQQDQDFAATAAADNQAELELATLAEQKAESDPVKDYAAMLVEDHTEAGEELKQIAEEQGISLPSDLPPEAVRKKEELSSLSGAAFDRAFIEAMVMGHDKAVQLYEEQAANGQNDGLKQFATSKVDTLRMHLDQARQLDRQVGQQTTAAGEPSAMQQDNPLMQMKASELVGKSVVNSAGEEVGEIEDIVIGAADKDVQAVISVGGFMGIGDKSIAVPFDELQPGEEESVLLSSGATIEELKQRPTFDEASGEYESYPPGKTPAEAGL